MFELGCLCTGADGVGTSLRLQYWVPRLVGGGEGGLVRLYLLASNGCAVMSAWWLGGVGMLV